MTSLFKGPKMPKIEEGPSQAQTAAATSKAVADSRNLAKRRFAARKGSSSDFKTASIQGSFGGDEDATVGRKKVGKLGS